MAKEGTPGKGSAGAGTSEGIERSGQSHQAPESDIATAVVSETLLDPGETTGIVEIRQPEGIIHEFNGEGTTTTTSPSFITSALIAKGDSSFHPETHLSETATTTPILEFSEEQQPIEKIQDEPPPEEFHELEDQLEPDQERMLAEMYKEQEWQAFVNFAHALFEIEFQQLIAMLNKAESKVAHAENEANRAKRREDPILPGQSLISSAKNAVKSIENSLALRANKWKQRWAHLNFRISKIVLNTALRQTEAAIGEVKRYIDQPRKETKIAQPKATRNHTH